MLKITYFSVIMLKVTYFRVTMAKVTSERPMSGNSLTPDKVRPLLEDSQR
jgi:hypothetical protein